MASIGIDKPPLHCSYMFLARNALQQKNENSSLGIQRSNGIRMKIE